MFFIKMITEVSKMKEVIKNNMEGLLFCSVIIIIILCVNCRYKYLNNMEGGNYIYNNISVHE